MIKCESCKKEQYALRSIYVCADCHKAISEYLRNGGTEATSGAGQPQRLKAEICSWCADSAAIARVRYNFCPMCGRKLSAV